MGVKLLVCQSCSMPLLSNGHLGKNSDGTLNDEYCKDCFSDGEFTAPNMSLEQMIYRAAGMIASKHEVQFSQAYWAAQSYVPGLKRWGKTNGKKPARAGKFKGKKSQKS